MSTDNHMIIVEPNEQGNYITVRCNAGHKITTWNEGDPIEEYNSFTIMYCPMGWDISMYHCITDEQHELYNAQQEQWFKEKQEALEKEMALSENNE